MACAVHWSCARSRCAMEAIIAVDDYDLNEPLLDFLPAGWKREVGGSGIDFVIHCPEHTDMPQTGKEA